MTTRKEVYFHKPNDANVDEKCEQMYDVEANSTNVLKR